MNDINEIGYHGTSKSNALSILSEGFRPSTKKNEWLGHGIYFFSSFKAAEYWAKKDKNKNPSVLQSTLSAKRKECLDLNIPTDWEKYYKFVSSYIKEVEKCGDPLPKFEGKNREESQQLERCFWCNLYAKMYSIKMISLSFSPIKNGYSFGVPTLLPNRQICVFDQSIILDTKEVQP